MYKKRLIGVLTVKDSHCFQSKKFREYLPLGKPEFLIENLDRWNVDEILVNCIDRTRKGLGPDLDLLKKISKRGLSTPLTYGGGIRSLNDALEVISNGAERVLVDQIVSKDLNTLKDICKSLGRQAIIYSCPVLRKNNILYHVDYLNKKKENLKSWFEKYIKEENFSEILIIDYLNEGHKEGFDFNIIKCLPNISNPFLIFGGLTNPKQINKLLCDNRVVGIGIGNALSFKENNVQKFKSKINSIHLRAPIYSEEVQFL